MKRCLILFFALASLLFSAVNTAAIVKYVDANGRTIFVDDESKIPAQYLKKSEEIQGLPEMSSEEKSAQSERLKRAREKQQDKLKENRKKRAKQELQKHYETPILVRGNQVLVPVEVAYGQNKVDVLLQLDTGSEATLLNRDALNSLNIGSETGKINYVIGISGKKQRIRNIKFKYMKIGPYKVEKASAYIIDKQIGRDGYDGLLGMDYIKQLPYEIDYNRQIIRWRP